jgi:DNA-binding MarR family transcriptional regulator
MSSKKTNIQEKILDFLQGRKAVNREILTNELESGFLGDFEPFNSVQGKPSSKPQSKTKYAINRSLKTLGEAGLIEELETPNSSFVRITPEGRHKLRNLKLSSPTSLVSTSWDGYWRMVMLDLPESRKSERNSLRYILKKAGFVMLKNSVWVSPFPLEHLFMNIKKDMGLTTEITILVTQLLDPETEQELVRIFGFE